VFCLVQENRRLESELLEMGEKLVEYQSLASKLQRNLENVLAEKVNPHLLSMLPELSSFSVTALEQPTELMAGGSGGSAPDVTKAQPT